MPLLALERIPLPSLKTYTALSVALCSISIYYAVQVSSDPSWKVNGTKIEFEIEPLQNFTEEIIYSSWSKYQNETFVYELHETAQFMIQEPFCVWSMVNMAYCCLLLLGTLIQKIVFGELRASEQQHFKDKFWHFIFYKFIFVFGIINVQYLHEVVFWCAWFSILGFLNLLIHLGKDRFEYLSFSPTTSNWTHFRLLTLMAGIFVLSAVMFSACVFVGIFTGFDTFAFMGAECIQLNIRTLHVILRYSLYLYDLRRVENVTLTWEKRGPVAYYVELFFELSVLILDFIHHLHMLLWSNIFLSIASFVICMQLRHLFQEIQRRVRKHRNYLWVLNHMEENYPMATAEELSAHKDNCAICWEEMDTARKLPCTHLFHASCLQSWLEQDTSCPTCRMALSMQNRNMLDAVSRLEHSLENNGDNQPGNRRPHNHFFHFDGSRYVSWLPSFSVEVTSAQINTLQAPMQNSQFDAMARQVQQLFPHIPLSMVIEDLRLSRSVELTVENILDGRIIPPAHFFQRDPTPPPTPAPERWTETVTESTADKSVWVDGIDEDSSAENSENEDAPVLDHTFSNSSAEREKNLQKKKEQLMKLARRKYLKKCKKQKRVQTEES